MHRERLGEGPRSGTLRGRVHTCLECSTSSEARPQYRPRHRLRDIVLHPHSSPSAGLEGLFLKMDTLSPGATVKVPWNSKVQVLYGQLWLFMSNIASKRKSSHLVQGIDPSSYQEQGATLKQCGLKNSHVTKMIHFGSSCSVYKCSLYSPNLRGKWSPLTQTPRMKVWVSHQVSSSVLQRWEVGWRTDVKRRTMMSRDVSGAATGAEVARACATAFCS